MSEYICDDDEARALEANERDATDLWALEAAIRARSLKVRSIAERYGLELMAHGVRWARQSQEQWAEVEARRHTPAQLARLTPAGTEGAFAELAASLAKEPGE